MTNSAWPGLLVRDFLRARRNRVVNYSNFKVRALPDKFLTKDFLRKLKDYLNSVGDLHNPGQLPYLSDARSLVASAFDSND